MRNVNIFMSTVIMVSFIVTIILAVASYGAYKLRERRRPRAARAAGAADPPVFFERFFPQRPDEPSPGEPHAG